MNMVNELKNNNLSITEARELRDVLESAVDDAREVRDRFGLFLKHFFEKRGRMPTFEEIVQFAEIDLGSAPSNDFISEDEYYVDFNYGRIEGTIEKESFGEIQLKDEFDVYDNSEYHYFEALSFADIQNQLDTVNQIILETMKEIDENNKDIDVWGDSAGYYAQCYDPQKNAFALVQTLCDADCIGFYEDEQLENMISTYSLNELLVTPSNGLSTYSRLVNSLIEVGFLNLTRYCEKNSKSLGIKDPVNTIYDLPSTQVETILWSRQAEIEKHRSSQER